MNNKQPSLNKGCYTCERRRIKCDRGSPSCLKCSRKGLTCPGYGTRIKWAGGAAVRGRLAQPRDAGPSSPGLSVSNDWIGQHSLTNKTLRELVECWDRNIAPLMVWVDTDDNPYRLYITPLAYTNPIIGLATAAVSSQHASGSKTRSILFSAYLTFLHDITLLSRQVLPSSDRWNRMGMTFDYILAKFEIARGETLMTAGRLALQPDSRRQDFICVVNIHHYAALLYAIRCLQLDVRDQRRRELVDARFAQTAIMTAVDEWLHTLAWSFFIAGVEVYDDLGKQSIISDLYDRICKVMRFHNFRDASDFLNIFWAGVDQDWRTLEQNWEVDDHPVLLP